MTVAPSNTASTPDQRHGQLARCFSTLDKVVRGMRLYEGKGPLVDRLTTDMELQLRSLLEDGEVSVRVTPVGLVYRNKPLAAAGEKTPGYLFRLFCDGVRELTFLPGVELSELSSFITVLNSDTGQEDEDLVTLLWKQEMDHIQYFAADTLDTSTQVDTDGELGQAYEASASRLRQGGQSSGGEEVQLSADDLRVLRQDESLNWVRGCTAPTRATGALAEAASRIKQAFVSPQDHTRFLEIALRHSQDEATASPLVLNMIDAQLRTGEIDSLGPVLEAIITTAAEGSEPAIALQEHLGEVERMVLLAPVYSQHMDRLAPTVRALAAANSDSIVPLLQHIDSTEAKAALHKLLLEASVDLTPFYVGHLHSDEEGEIISGLQTLGEMGTPEALKAILSTLGHTLTTVRRAALQALGGHYDPEARMAIGRALKDPSGENRLLAIDILARSGDTRVAWLLLNAIQSASFLDKPAAEQSALFSALGSFQDSRTLDFFKSVLTAGNLMKKQALTDRQLQAAGALAQIGTPEAITALKACRSKWGLSKVVKAEIDRLLARAGS
jgi:hypothetical protein